ncbi:MAG: chaperone modulator CbpM [Steroidobacteraceae bacterium]
MSRTPPMLTAEVLTESHWIAVTQLCELCRLDLAAVEELAELGVVSPRQGRAADWQFPATVLPRLRIVSRLMRDLGVNVSGAVLALELLESQRALERRLRALEGLLAGER